MILDRKAQHLRDECPGSHTHCEHRQRSAEDFRRRAGLVYLPSSSGGLTFESNW